MDAVEFAKILKAERDAMLALYQLEGRTSVATHLAEAGLSDDQRSHVEAALEQALTDVIYSMLLGLDGAASLGGLQIAYDLRAEDGSLVCTGDGTLEAAAGAVFGSRL